MAESVLVYDCFSGLSGDMHIGAMLDLGVPEAYLRDALARLPMAREFELMVEPGAKMGITGTRATVALREHSHEHRHLADIRNIIDQAGYPTTVRERSLDIFERIAVAEAKIHGTSIDEVHFHEVGATDSIVDIVAAALCLEHLAVDRVHCTTLELGGGTVRCAHGVMPVPAPATAEMLTGVPCRYDGVESEATTPTGAAILRHAVDEFSAPQGFRSERIGYGIGQKDFRLPNVVRVMLGTAEAAQLESERNREISCNIDDMSPEAFQPVMEQLFAAGARDVFLTPVIMKKTRPGTKLSVLCAPDDEAQLLELLFRNTTTIGVRVHDVHKRMLPRELTSVTTSLGDVQVKIVTLPDGTRRWKLEHDDCLALAASRGLTYLDVRARLEAELRDRLDGSSGDAR